MKHNEFIIMMDCAGTNTELLTQNIPRVAVYGERNTYTSTAKKIQAMNPNGIILSGGLHNIDDADCHRYDPDIFNLGLPVLGIGYGMQLIAQQYGGYVEKAADRKYEKSRLTVNNDAR